MPLINTSFSAQLEEKESQTITEPPSYVTVGFRQSRLSPSVTVLQTFIIPSDLNRLNFLSSVHITRFQNQMALITFLHSLFPFDTISGINVWFLSSDSAMKILCTQMIYNRLMDNFTTLEPKLLRVDLMCLTNKLSEFNYNYQWHRHNWILSCFPERPFVFQHAFP